MLMECISRHGCGNGLVISPARERYSQDKGEVVFLTLSDLGFFATAVVRDQAVIIAGSLVYHAKSQKRDPRKI